jgi:hypothetical protein
LKYSKSQSLRFNAKARSHMATLIKSLLEKRFMVTPRIFLWCRLIISTVTKNILSFLVSAVLTNRHEKYGNDCLKQPKPEPGRDARPKNRNQRARGRDRKISQRASSLPSYPLIGSSLFSLLSFGPLSSLFSLVLARRQSAR